MHGARCRRNQRRVPPHRFILARRRRPLCNASGFAHESSCVCVCVRESFSHTHNAELVNTFQTEPRGRDARLTNSSYASTHNWRYTMTIATIKNTTITTVSKAPLIQPRYRTLWSTRIKCVTIRHYVIKTMQQLLLIPL